MPIVDDLQLPPFTDFPQFAPVYYATVDQTKFVLPYIICSRDERGPELMAHILAPMRSDRNMNIVKPCRDKWSFAISIFGVRQEFKNKAHKERSLLISIVLIFFPVGRELL
jgi:hypothetical protein